MNIRAKVILVVLPLIITPVLFAGFISTLLARNGITGVATQFLQFKSEQIVSYANGQWKLLQDNDLEARPDYIEAAVSATRDFAAGVIRSQTELIFAVDSSGEIAFSTDPDLDFTDLELPDTPGWNRLTLGSTTRVGYALQFDPLQWTVYVTEVEETFYASTSSIIRQVGIVLAVSVVVSLVLLILFSGYLTRPLRRVAEAMGRITETNDLSQRVEVLFKDETGRLAHTFNHMIEDLERSQNTIKAEVVRAATAEIKEKKTRTIFQKYVPAPVIEQFFQAPEKMLVGEDRLVSVLFSDIRDFTTLSESMEPDVLVESLNRYFTLMVEQIYQQDGVVDKFIGDALMGLFGNMEKRPDDVKRSVLAALDMVDQLKIFNNEQIRRDLRGFRIGIGIHYGRVTVGNIGSEKRKLDYTVIGDSVNVASRLEGLTKRYDWPLVISGTVQQRIGDDLPTRLLDNVQVKGRQNSVPVYAVARDLDKGQLEAWATHDRAMEYFVDREFETARTLFNSILESYTQDRPAELMVERCTALIEHPPEEGWKGELAMDAK